MSVAMPPSDSWLRRMRYTPFKDWVRLRLTGQLDPRRLLAETDLPGPAKTQILQVLKKTRLWRGEKIDVAEELIAHFRDGRDAGRTAEQMITDFGDPAVAARLIRRSVKRNRPMPWHVAAWTLKGFGVLLLLYVGMAVYLSWGSPSIKTDYLTRLNQKALAVPPEDAAWPIYREVLLAISETNEFDQRHFTIDTEPRPGEEGWDELQAFLESHTHELAMIRTAAGKPGNGYIAGFTTHPADVELFGEQQHMASSAGPHPPLNGVLLPHLGYFRSMARLLLADIYHALEQQDAERVIADLHAIHGIAKHADEQDILINGLVRLAIHALGHQTLEHTLIHHPDLLSDTHLRELAHAIASHETNWQDWFNGERYWVYDMLQRIYTDDGHGGGRITDEGLRELNEMSHFIGIPDSDAMTIETVTLTLGAMNQVRLPAAALVMADRREMREEYDRLMDAEMVLGTTPLWQQIRQRSVDPSEPTLEELMSSPGYRRQYYLISVYMPSMQAFRSTLISHETNRQVTLLTIALELYRRQEGDWPESLAQLSPRWNPPLAIGPVHRRTAEVHPGRWATHALQRRCGPG